MHSITINGQDFPIIIRRRKASKRMTIRYLPMQRSVALTIPRYTPIRQGLSFAHEKQGWLRSRIEEAPSGVPFEDGQDIPVLGEPHTIKHEAGRGVARCEHGIISVQGAPEFISRRVTDWLKKLAKEEITRRCAEKAVIIGKKPAKISLRDTQSLWGSCNHKGNLSFSWRLVMAPPEILDYLVSHEMAHLIHMNHSPRFWEVVARLCPDYERCQHWLKQHGTELYRYGA